MLVSEQKEQKNALHDICLDYNVPNDIEKEILSFLEPMKNLEQVLMRQVVNNGEFKQLPPSARDLICEYLFTEELVQLRPLDVFDMYKHW